MSVTLDLRIETPAWAEAIEDIEAVCKKALLAGFSQTAKAGEVAVLLTDDDELRQLNRDWRGKDRTTDVLSFPASAAEAPFLGDIAVALGVSTRDCHERGVRLADHLSHLLIHGYLHLLGYDHMEDTQANQMEAIEVQALATLGIADPYSTQS